MFFDYFSLLQAYPTPVSTPDIDEQRSLAEVDEGVKEESVIPPQRQTATLSVANVNQQATEDEIRTVFSRFVR